ncbi:hypothetical protein MsAm2_01730 [Methanolapillus ohkumae]|uniref:Uncharacterized protein n=1 Tax=Methanolapillus ohkumae TaxID=3028298 RepID=A0AA96V4G2_9EURY|nr:hypothetical protein MsAm2_01730 [Methanosarcinaceae archaeon Am2]
MLYFLIYSLFIFCFYFPSCSKTFRIVFILLILNFYFLSPMTRLFKILIMGHHLFFFLKTFKFIYYLLYF